MKLIDEIIKELNGRRHERLPFWNSSDDNPLLNHTNYSFRTSRGEVYVEAFEVKEGVVWPDYPCNGDSYKNKFAVNIRFADKPNIVTLSDFIDINKENVERILGQFRQLN